MSFSEMFAEHSRRAAVALAAAACTAFSGCATMDTKTLVRGVQGSLKHDGFVIRRGAADAVKGAVDCNVLGRTYRCPQGDAPVSPRPER